MPQPQDELAFGLITLKAAPIRSSTKSSSAPFRNSSEVEIDKDGDAVALDREVVFGARIVQREIVLEARTAAARHRQPQHHGRGLGLEDFGDPPGGAGGNRHRRLGDKAHVGIPNLCGEHYVVVGGIGAKPMLAKTGPAGRLLPPLFEPPRQAAPYATLPKHSRGRLYPEAESATRTCYQRDRDRILHSTAFRRLKQKTQVFVQHEGDYYRTRLTHSLEVAQIARSLARVLALDEDLAEALALAHDLGHTPFGHAGEEALAAATAHIGGFDHNAHALRIVTKLEHRYAAFDGLNLTWETLEGLVKHNGPLQPGKGLPGPIASFDARWPLDLGSYPGLEAQVAALADDIAYTNHDIDDGLRAGLFTAADLASAPMVGEHVKAILAENGDLELNRLIGEIVRRLMSALIDDLLAETRCRLGRAAPASVGEVRQQSSAFVAFSEAMSAEMAQLKGFLFAHMYRHPRVLESMSAAKQVVSGLFAALTAEPRLLPADWCEACGNPGDPATAGVVRDYIAGMTDRYALEEHRRIFHTEIAL